VFNKLESFAVEMANGPFRFFEANRVCVRRGRLIFVIGLWRVAGIVERGQWRRVIEGVTREDIDNG